MKKLILLLLTLFSIQVNAQISSSCGTTQFYEQNPDLLKKILKFQKDNNKLKGTLDITPDNTTLYTIPLVFQVYHLGEAVGTGSNVSVAAIQASVDRLNATFRATGIHAGLTPDVKIQFVLASFDPNCQPSNGIVRVDGRSIAGYEANAITFEDFNMHQSLTGLSSWDESKYINIRIVHNTNGYGWAYYLGDVFIGAPQVTTQTNYPGLDNFWAHELGHSLNLLHTFEGDGGNQNCPSNIDPENEGDRVADTDPHKRDAGCSYTSINPCTGNAFGDILKNIMSYSCTEKFTPKQIQRMRFALLNFKPTLINSKGITGITGPPLASSQLRCSPASVLLKATGCIGTYNWYSSSVGGTSIGTGETFTTPVVSSTTTYYVSCTETICGISTRTPVTVTINPGLSVGVCSVVAPNGLSYFFGISNFTLGSLSFQGNTSFDVGSNYIDYTCLRTNLKEDSASKFMLKSVYGVYMFGKIYIDYNNDGDFNDPNEFVFGNTTAIDTISGFITPPSTALKNTYLRLRVLFDPTNGTACTLPGEEFNGSGLALDYAVQILPKACSLPSASLTGTQTITVGQAGNLSVALTGAAPWSVVMNATTYTANTSPFTISVSPNITTTYTLTSVSNSCGAGTVSGTPVITVVCPASLSFPLGVQTAGVYKAIAITSRSKPALTTQYNAANSVSLLPGFEAKPTVSSGVFKAEIKVCP
jgi:Ig-like domain CHU_C associated/Pregnancy-associated plasma protein-A/GEVED domain